MKLFVHSLAFVQEIRKQRAIVNERLPQFFRVCTAFAVGVGKHARVEWRPASGTLEHRFDDLPVPASRGLDEEMARGLEPFPTRDLVAYDPQFLSGFLAEEYAVALPEAYAAARRRNSRNSRHSAARSAPPPNCAMRRQATFARTIAR